MLIHIIPRIYLPEHARQCVLQGVEIPELDLHLRAGKEVDERRPYPNKHYSVVCRKVGQRAWDGILLETAKSITTFTSIASWLHLPTGRQVQHKVHYAFADEQYDAATSSMVRWDAFPELGWDDRWPEHAKEWTPASAQPRMELVATARHGDFADFVESGLIVCREEYFTMPTVPRERVAGDALHKNWLQDRQPPLEHAFQA